MTAQRHSSSPSPSDGARASPVCRRVDCGTCLHAQRACHARGGTRPSRSAPCRATPRGGCSLCATQCMPRVLSRDRDLMWLSTATEEPVRLGDVSGRSATTGSARSCRPPSRRKDNRSSHHLPIHRSPSSAIRSGRPCRLVPWARQHGQCGIAGEPRIRRREPTQVEDRSTRRCDDPAMRARSAQAGVLVRGRARRAAVIAAVFTHSRTRIRWFSLSPM